MDALTRSLGAQLERVEDRITDREEIIQRPGGQQGISVRSTHIANVCEQKICIQSAVMTCNSCGRQLCAKHMSCHSVHFEFVWKTSSVTTSSVAQKKVTKKTSNNSASRTYIDNCCSWHSRQQLHIIYHASIPREP